MASDKSSPAIKKPRQSASDNTIGSEPKVIGPRRRSGTPTQLPVRLEAIHVGYVAQIGRVAVFSDNTRRAYASRVRQYLAWLADSDIDGDPRTDPGARYGAVCDYRTHLQTVAKKAPASINTVLASLADFYTRQGLGPPTVERLDLPKAAPRALSAKDTTRWLRTVERWPSPRDQVLAEMPFYAGTRIGEEVALDLDDIHLSARKGLIIVRSGKGGRYREAPVNPRLHQSLKLWIENERPDWPGAETNPAVFLNHRSGRLTTRGARNILAAVPATSSSRSPSTPTCPPSSPATSCDTASAPTSSATASTW